jgi:glycosyltransferase involved in cell wall biosynthesis
MLRWGREPCGVAWSDDACTTCVMKTLGVPGILDLSLRWMPPAVAELVARQGRHGGGWTAVRLPALMHARLEALDELFRLASRIISPAPWVTEVLVGNGVPRDRLVEIGHGVVEPAGATLRRRAPDGAVRFVHLGRLDRAKGTGLLVDAIRPRRELAVTLDVFGIENQTDANAYGAAVRERAAGDDRIRFHAAVPHDEVVPLLAGYDAVVVPSQGFETGPLVVLEAFAAGTPVIGSALGGIADKVRHGVDGLLVPAFDDRQAWEDVVATCAARPELLVRLAANVRKPPSMSDVVADVAEVYQVVVADQAVSR